MMCDASAHLSVLVLYYCMYANMKNDHGDLLSVCVRLSSEDREKLIYGFCNEHKSVSTCVCFLTHQDDLRINIVTDT